MKQDSAQFQQILSLALTSGLQDMAYTGLLEPTDKDISAIAHCVI
jgi:hypothetical protein